MSKTPHSELFLGAKSLRHCRVALQGTVRWQPSRLLGVPPDPTQHSMLDTQNILFIFVRASFIDADDLGLVVCRRNRP